MKFTKTALMLAAATSLVSAKAHHGFAVGVNAGYVKLDNKTDFKSSNAAPTKYKNDQSGRGFLGGLTLGYFNGDWGGFNAGVQLEGNFSSGEGKTEQTAPGALAWKLETRQKWETNAMVRLGMNHGCALPYLGVGASMSQFEAYSKADLAGKANQTTKKTLFGPTVALGVDFAVSDKMVVGGSFRTSFYPGFDAKQKGTSLTYTHNIKPTTMVGSVNVKYFF